MIIYLCLKILRDTEMRCGVITRRSSHVKYLRISGDFDECFWFPRFLGYEAAKLHSQRDPGRPRNPKRLKRERYDLPWITSYQFGLRCPARSWPWAKALERDPWNSRLQDLGISMGLHNPGIR